MAHHMACTIWYVLYGIYSMACTLWHLLYGMYSISCTLCHILYGMYSVACTLWHVLYGMYSMACTLWHVLYGMYSMSCTLWHVLYGESSPFLPRHSPSSLHNTEIILLFYLFCIYFFIRQYSQLVSLFRSDSIAGLGPGVQAILSYRQGLDKDYEEGLRHSQCVAVLLWRGHS